MKTKRTFAFLLSICMVMGSGSLAQAAGEETPDIRWEPYSETVTLTTAFANSSYAIDFSEGEDFQNNAWYSRWLERFNIQVENAWVVENADDYNTKINLSIADNDLPDVFTVSSPGEVNQLIEAGIAMDITDVFDAYASDLVKEFMEAAPDIAETAWSDGRMYAVPQLTYGIITQPWPLWIRKDWKEEQNAEAPRTWDELVELLRLFHEKYGAVLGENSSLSHMMHMAIAWGAYPTTWLRTENGIEYGGVQPEVKDVLAAYKALYEEGLLYDEFMVANEEKFVELCTTGKSGVFNGANWFDAYFIHTLEINGMSSYGEAYATPSATGEPVLYPIDFSNEGYVIINRACEHPEAAIKLINYYAQTIFAGNEKPDEEGMDPELMAELYKIGNVCGAFRIYDPSSEYNQHLELEEAVKSGDGSKLQGLSTIQKWELIQTWLNDQNPDGMDPYMQAGDPEVSAYAVNRRILDNGEYFNNALWGIYPESLTAMGSTLGDILIQGYTQIIVGERPLEYFDELVESWKAAGGEQVTQDMNELYNE